MQVGDLVSVRQQYGCHVPPRFRDRGLGVVLRVIKTSTIDIGTAMNVYLGDDVEVALTSGVREVFNERSVKVVNAGR